MRDPGKKKGGRNLFLKKVPDAFFILTFFCSPKLTRDRSRPHSANLRQAGITPEDWTHA